MVYRQICPHLPPTMPSTLLEQIHRARALQEELAPGRRPLSDPRRVEFTAASCDVVEGLLAINGASRAA
jgi:hypothetical protein